MPANIPNDIGKTNRQFITLLNAIALVLFLVSSYFIHALSKTTQIQIQSISFALLFFVSGTISFYCYRRASSSVSYLKSLLKKFAIPFIIFLSLALGLNTVLPISAEMALPNGLLFSLNLADLTNGFAYLQLVQALVVISIAVLPLYYLSSWNQHFLTLGIMMSALIILLFTAYTFPIHLSQTVIFICTHSLYFLCGGLIFCQASISKIAKLGFILGVVVTMVLSLSSLPANITQISLNLTILSLALLFRQPLSQLTSTNHNVEKVILLLHKMADHLFLLSGLFLSVTMLIAHHFFAELAMSEIKTVSYILLFISLTALILTSYGLTKFTKKWIH